MPGRRERVCVWRERCISSPVHTHTHRPDTDAILTTPSDVNENCLSSSLEREGEEGGLEAWVRGCVWAVAWFRICGWRVTGRGNGCIEQEL